MQVQIQTKPYKHQQTALDLPQDNPAVFWVFYGNGDGQIKRS